MEKYLNEAIIGNKNMLATFSSKGEMLRLSYPNRDNRQYLNFLHMGLKINDSDIIIPKLIITLNKDIWAFMGKIKGFTWMGYEFKTFYDIKI